VSAAIDSIRAAIASATQETQQIQRRLELPQMDNQRAIEVSGHCAYIFWGVRCGWVLSCRKKAVASFVVLILVFHESVLTNGVIT
jgi:hypothetical protein